MKRKLTTLLVLTTLLITTLGSKPVCALGFCESCSGQCVSESRNLYDTCRSNGGSSYTCEQNRLDYNWNCHAVFCPGCPVYAD